MKLVSDWKCAWRWFSMWALGAGMAVQVSYMALPDAMRAAIPEKLVHGLAIFALLASAVGRMINQTKGPDNGPPEP